MSNEKSSTALTVSPFNLKKHALNCIKSKTPFMVWGNPGIGKSEILKMICEMLGYHFEDIRLSQIDSIDLRGLPTKGEGDIEDAVDQLSGKPQPTVDWAVPDFLKRARKIKRLTGKNTAFFFDEINAGSPATMAAAYQFINDGRIGPHELGANDIVFAAGNLDTDGGITNTMPTPLCNRFRHYILKVNVESFLEFASQSNFHPWVTGYLSVSGNQGHLQVFDPDHIMASEEKAYATPRSWSMLSRGLKAAYIEDQQDDDEQSNIFASLDDDYTMKMSDLSSIAASCIGSGIATQFAAFVKEGMDLPKAKDILSGKGGKVDIKDSPSKQYFIANDCCHALKEYKDKVTELQNAKLDFAVINKEYMEAMENFVNFAKLNFGPEMFIFAVVSTMIKRFRLLPVPGIMTQKTFDLIIKEFEKAKTSR